MQPLDRLQLASAEATAAHRGAHDLLRALDRAGHLDAAAYATGRAHLAPLHAAAETARAAFAAGVEQLRRASQASDGHAAAAEAQRQNLSRLAA